MAVEVAPDTSAAWADPVRVPTDPSQPRRKRRERYGGPNRRIVVAPGESCVALEIRDDGRPLPARDRERIFGPYTRAHDRPGVTVSVGLGLSVSRQLARLMGGDLTYHHNGEEGAFRLTLPAVSAASRSDTGRLITA
ncbi:hypothetical protein BH23ACT5_BH23ACT5_23080 [soil metagenome]